MVGLPEHRIREAVLQRVARTFASDPTTRIVEELGLLNGQSRIDVAAINGHLHGFEIKSDFDTLARLPAQSASYDQVFDYTTIVCSEKFAPQCAQTLPQHWGIMLARSTTRSTVSLAYLRPAKINRNRDDVSLLRLLWNDELIAALRTIGAPASIARKSKYAIAQHISQTISRREISSLVRTTLKSRATWRHRLPS